MTAQKSPRIVRRLQRLASDGTLARVGSAPMASGEWLLADIGGTLARFATWTNDIGLAGRGAVYRNDDFGDLPALIERYRRDLGRSVLQCLLALALPLAAGEMRMTNRTWSFTPAGLCSTLALKRLRLVNDFVAAAAGIGALSASERIRIGGAEPASGATLILGPGTGLGAAFVIDDGAAPHVLATEAGHVGAAPTGADAHKVVERMRTLLGRVSWERLLCGNGLAAFDAMARNVSAPLAPDRVAELANAGDRSARSAASAFSFALGEFAGDLCLALRATGGVYLVGGVLTGLAGAFDADALRAGFENKGRMAALLRDVPCYRVQAEDLALRGLVRILDGSVRAPLLDIGDDGTADIES